MKTIKDLSRNEVVSLSEEQLHFYLGCELVANGFPIDILDKKPRVEIPRPVAPEVDKTVYRIGNSSLAVDNMEDAVKITNMLFEAGTCTLDHIYIGMGSGFDYMNYRSDTITSLDVASVKLYKKKDVFDFDKEVGRYNDAIKAEDKKDERIDDARKVADNFWAYVSNIKNERVYNEQLKELFSRYLEITEGNKDKAMQLIRMSYPFNEETESFLMADDESEDVNEIVND